MIENKRREYENKRQNYKATICTVILVMTAIMVYACLNLLLPFLNEGTGPSPFHQQELGITKEIEPSGEGDFLLQDDVALFDENPNDEVIEDIGQEYLIEEYEPKDYSIVDDSLWTEEQKANYQELVQNATIKYAIAEVTVRSGPSYQSLALGGLGVGDKVLLKEVGSTFDTILWEGKLAYVKTHFLSDQKLENKEVEFHIRELDPEKPMVALTFDDGPNPIATPRILDVLQEYGVVATFFDLGNLMEKYPEVVKREEAIGCEVGSHSYQHKNLVTLSAQELEEDSKKVESVFEAVLGHKPKLFRPPYGNINTTLKEVMDYPIITWNVDSLDWKLKNKNKNLAQIRKTGDYDGKIILMHSIYGTTADTVEVLVPELLEKGYQLVTVPELVYYKKGVLLKTRNVYNGF